MSGVHERDPAARAGGEALFLTHTRAHARALVSFIGLSLVSWSLGCEAPAGDIASTELPASDGGSRDAGSDAASETDAAVDVTLDARPPTPPPSCAPAACEGEGEAPPWGCPSACDPACAGDTVCCDDGSCLRRAFDDCTSGCEGELTISLDELALIGMTLTRVCNRGSNSVDAVGRVALALEGEVVCEADLDTTIESCDCVFVRCDIQRSVWDDYGEPTIPLRAELVLDEPLECGNPLGRVTEAEVEYLFPS